MDTSSSADLTTVIQGSTLIFLVTCESYLPSKHFTCPVRQMTHNLWNIPALWATVNRMLLAPLSHLIDWARRATFNVEPCNGFRNMGFIMQSSQCQYHWLQLTGGFCTCSTMVCSLHVVLFSFVPSQLDRALFQLAAWWSTWRQYACHCVCGNQPSLYLSLKFWMLSMNHHCAPFKFCVYNYWMMEWCASLWWSNKL